jgi:hypothetical protein
VYSDSSHYSYVKPNGITISNSIYTETSYTEKAIDAYAAYTINAHNGLSLDVSNIGARTIDLKAGSLSYASFASTNSYVYGGNSRLSLGRASSGFYLGFFGSNGSTKKNVSNITSPSSASTATIANKVNELLNALKGYGIIG